MKDIENLQLSLMILTNIVNKLKQELKDKTISFESELKNINKKVSTKSDKDITNIDKVIKDHFKDSEQMFISKIDKHTSEIETIASGLKNMVKQSDIDKIVKTLISKKDIKEEITRLEEAIKEVKEKIKETKDGINGKDGIDGKTPEIEIGKIETISAGQDASVSLVKKGDKYKLNLSIPRGVSGGNGRPATINGLNTLDIKAGTNITLDQDNDGLTINASGGGTTEETDPIFNASASKNITSNDITNWNGKSDFSGDYEDLDNKPAIPNYTSGTGICMEDSVINSCTECGTDLTPDYIKDITVPNGNWKMCHTYDGALILFQVGSATIQVSRNYIDFEDYTFAHTVKDINYAYNNNVVLVLCNDGYIYYSFDDGITWVELYLSALVSSGAGYEKIYIDNSRYTTTSTSPFTLFKLYGESGTRRYLSGALVNTNGTWGINVSNIYITPEPIRWVIKFGNDEMLITPTGATYKASGSNIVALNKDLPSGTITCVYTLNGVSIAGYGTTGKYAIYDSLSDTWGERNLPTDCTINAILYDNGKYYFLTDNANYYTTEVFDTYIKVEETTDRFKDGAFTLIGLVLIPNSEEDKLVLVPQRTFIDDILLKLLRGIDKTRWVSDGLQVIGEKVQVKPGDSTIQVTNRGANVGIGSLSDIYLDQATKLKLDMATSIIGKVAIANLESWFYTYADFDPFTLFRIIFVDGGTTYNPLDYSDLTVNAGDYGYFLINATVDAMPFTLIGNINEWSA